MKEWMTSQRALSGRIVALVLIMLYVLLMLIAAIFAIRKLIPTDKEILALIKSQLEFSTGTKVHIGKVSGSPFKSVRLHDVRVGEEKISPTGAMLTCERIDIKLNLPALLNERSMQDELIRQIELHSPTLHLHRDAQGIWNFQKIFKPKKPARPPAFAIRLTAINGSIIYEDETVKLASGRAMKLELHRVHAKAVFHPKPTTVRQQPILEWELTGVSDKYAVRRISANGVVAQGGMMHALFKITAQDVTPQDLPIKLTELIRRQIEWMGGKASVSLIADFSKGGRDEKLKTSLKLTFVAHQSSIRLKGAMAEPFSATSISGSANIVAHGGKLIKGGIIAHAVDSEGKFGSANIELAYSWAQIYSRITLLNASLRWLQDELEKSLKMPYGLCIHSGRAEQIDVTLKRSPGKPMNIEARLKASNLLISTSLLKCPTNALKLDLQCYLTNAPKRAPTGRAILNVLLPPIDGAPPASISARINAWANIFSGRIAIANLSAKMLNILRDDLLPFTGKLTDGLLNMSFSLYAPKDERKGWLGSQIELSDVSIRQLRVKGLPQWDELFPDGADFQRVHGSARYSDGMWQIIGLGFSHRDFDAALEGAISERPLAFRLAAKLFGVNLSSAWRAIRQILTKGNLYRQLDLDAVPKGQINLQMLGTRKMLIGGIEIDAPSVHLSGEGIGSASISSVSPSVQFAYIRDKPPRLTAHISFQEAFVRDAHYGADRWADIERLDASTPVELLGIARLSKVTLQLGDEMRARSSVNVKQMRLGKLILSDVQFEIDVCGRRIELNKVKGKLAGGAVIGGTAAIEHIGGKEIERADFACTVERIRLAHVLNHLDNGMLPPSIFIDGVASGRLSISLDDAQLGIAYIGEIESPTLAYEGANDDAASRGACAIASANLNGNSAQLQMQLELARLKKSYRLSGGTLVASLDRGRGRIMAGDGKLVDLPLASAFARAKFDRAVADVTEAQCIAWDAKLRGRAKWDSANDELQAQVLFSELNLSELNDLLGERISGRCDGLVTFTKARSEQQLEAQLNACNLRLPIKVSTDGGSKRKENEKTKFIRLPYMSANMRWDGEKLEVKSAKVHYADSEFEVYGSVEGFSDGLKKARANLRAYARAVDIGRALSEFGVDADFEGVGNVEAQIAGILASPTVKASINVPLPLVAGMAFEWMDGHVFYDASLKSAIASPLRLRVADSEAIISAKVSDIFNSNKLDGEVSAEKLRLAWLLRQVAPKVSIEGFVKSIAGSISGTLTNPSLNARLSIEDAKFHGTVIGDGDGRIILKRLGKDEYSVNALFEMKPRHGNATLNLSLTKLNEKLSLSASCDGDGLQLAWVEGLLNSLSASLRAQGKKVPTVDEAIKTVSKLPHPLSGALKLAAAYLRDGDEQRWRIECAIPKLHMGRSGPYGLWAKLHGDASQRHIEELRIAHADAAATCSGVVDKDGSMNLKASLNKLRLSSLSHFPKLRLPIDATVTASALIFGSLDEPKLDITGEAVDMRYKDLRIERMKFKSVRYQDDKLLAERGDLVIQQSGHSILLWGKLPLKLRAKAPKEALDVHMQLIGAPITLWQSFLIPVDEASIGHFNIDMHLGGVWELPMLYGKLTVSAPKLCLMNGRATLSDLNVDIVADGRRAKIEQCSMNWNGGKITVDGYIELGKEALASPMANKADLNISVSDVPLAFGGLISLGRLSASWRLQSLADSNGLALQLLSASLSDQPQAIRADGFAQWHSALLASWEALKPSQLMRRLMLANCNFNVYLNKLRLRLRDAFDGYVSGRLRLMNREPLPEGFKLSEIAAVEDLKHYIPEGMPTLTGFLTVHDGMMRGVPRVETGARIKPIGLAMPAIDVTLNLGNGVELRNVQISAPLRGQVSIKGYPNSPNITGRLYANRGVLRLPGGVLRLTIADIQISALPDSEAMTMRSFINLNVEARGRMGSYEVTMRASGPLGGAGETRWAMVKFASTPPLAEEEIARRLLGINLPKELGEDAYKSLVETITPTLQRAFASTVGGGLAQALGLEQITVEQEEGGRQRLGIGARISPSLYIRWYQGLAGQGSAIEVEQWLNRWVSFVWRQDERQRNEFRVQVHFQF
ncbi:MAG: translocation/assembly module TamB domain-containing protein [Armatimonadota bacterium]|nr:translocation/assembly module TamB domain-containing protein [Armatimonadota bacterium]MDW8025323.1 translocation/assembly module TamB domain-containing protein [Armatimonadota bacterium]